MPLTELATAAVAVILPLLGEMGSNAAQEAGKEAAKGVLDWMRDRLGGRAKDALADLEAKPDVEDNQGDLRKQLAKALEAEPALAEELRALLPDTAVQATQSLRVSGKGAIGVQVAGHGARLDIKGGNR